MVSFHFSPLIFFNLQNSFVIARRVGILEMRTQRKRNGAEKEEEKRKTNSFSQSVKQNVEKREKGEEI